TAGRARVRSSIHRLPRPRPLRAARRRHRCRVGRSLRAGALRMTPLLPALILRTRPTTLDELLLLWRFDPLLVPLLAFVVAGWLRGSRRLRRRAAWTTYPAPAHHIAFAGVVVVLVVATCS